VRAGLSHRCHTRADSHQFFGVLERTARGALSYRPSHEELSKLMQIYLINFVNTLDPNSGAATPDVAWPTYDKAQQNLVLKAGSVRLEKDDYRSEGTDYILKMALGKL
jgi:carboxylesterase type B